MFDACSHQTSQDVIGYILMPCHKNKSDRLQYSILVILDMWVGTATKSYHYHTMPRKFPRQILCDRLSMNTLQQLIQESGFPHCGT